MKKIIILVMIITLFTLVFTSCNNSATPSVNKSISDYVTKENGVKCIVLPESKEKVEIRKDYLPYINKIDVELLISAEKKINEQLKEYSEHSGLYLTVWKDYLCLSAEVIVEVEADLSEGEGGVIFDHEHKFFREKITKEKLGIQSNESSIEYYANHVLGTRAWDLRHPDDEDTHTVIDVKIPELTGLKVEYDAKNFKVKVGDKEFFGDSGYYCVSFYHADLTGDGCPELCFVSSFGSGIVNDSIEIYDATTDKFIFSLSDRGYHDYSLFLRNGNLCVKETVYASETVTRTGVLGNNGKEITVFWDVAPNADFDE